MKQIVDSAFFAYFSFRALGLGYMMHLHTYITFYSPFVFKYEI